MVEVIFGKVTFVLQNNVYLFNAKTCKWHSGKKKKHKKNITKQKQNLMKKKLMWTAYRIYPTAAKTLEPI